MIYSINMHTTVYQFWRFVQSVIDHYLRISLFTLSFCTKIRLHVYHLSLPPPPLIFRPPSELKRRHLLTRLKNLLRHFEMCLRILIFVIVVIKQAKQSGATPLFCPVILYRRFYPDITRLSGSDVFRQTNQDYSSVRLSGLDIRLDQTNYIQLYVWATQIICIFFSY